MFSKFLCGVAALFLTLTAVAQEEKPKGENRFSLSLGQQYNFNKSGIQNAPGGPQTLSIKNNFGGYVGLGYERVTRHGIVFSYDLQFRVHDQFVKLDYDLINVDPRGSEDLSTMAPVQKVYDATLYLLNHRFMTGYEHAIGNPRNGLRLQGKVGVSIGSLLNRVEGSSYNQTFVNFRDNNGSNVYIAKALAVSSNADPYDEGLARGYAVQKPQRFPLCGYAFNLYVGLVQKVDKPWLKSVSFGMEGRWSNGTAPTHIDVYIPENATSFQNSYTDRYSTVNRSIGLHLALNFWK
jgi:hypothetical protein